MIKILGLFGGNKERIKAASAEALLAEQNFARGVWFSLGTALLSIAIWVYLCLLFDRYFPWVSLFQGVMIGIAMQRYGKGLDWRFPVIAADITAMAAVVGSFLVALFLTGREFGTGALELVDEISLHTIKTFLTRDFGVVGLIYMGFAIALAAFFANRRLLPGEATLLKRHAVSMKPNS